MCCTKILGFCKMFCQVDFFPFLPSFCGTANERIQYRCEVNCPVWTPQMSDRYIMIKACIFPTWSFIFYIIVFRKLLCTSHFQKQESHIIANFVRVSMTIKIVCKINTTICPIGQLSGTLFIDWVQKATQPQTHAWHSLLCSHLVGIFNLCCYIQ